MLTFKSDKFGGGGDVPLTPAAGETMTLTDDSGTQFTLSPTPQVANTGKVLPTDPDFLNPGQLSVLTYATDDNTIGSGKGGVVVLNVTVSSPGGGNHGLLVKTTAQGTNGSVEIGTINVSGGRRFCPHPQIPPAAVRRRSTIRARPLERHQRRPMAPRRSTSSSKARPPSTSGASPAPATSIQSTTKPPMAKS